MSMKRKHMLCRVLCLSLAAAVLTACGDSSSKNSGAVSGSGETTTGISGTAPENTETAQSMTDTTAAEAATQTTVQNDYIPTNDKQYDTAYLTLDSYLKACATGDSDLVRGSSNLIDAYDIADRHAAQGVRYEQKKDAEVQVQCGIRSAKIGKGAAADALKDEYLASLTELEQAYAAASADLQLQAELSLKLDLRKPIDLLYAFPVIAQTADGASRQELYYVICSGHDWAVDLAAVPEFVQERRTAGMETAAANARNFYLAVNNALNDVAAQGADVRLIDGIYYYRGSDLVKAPGKAAVSDSGTDSESETVITAPAVSFERPIDVSDAVNTQLGKTCKYLKECDQVAYAVNGGICTAVALQCGGETDPLTETDQYYYGCYPHVLTEEDFGTFISIDDVMTHALG